jgi:glycosyltransferase involved in cell wall biosynthesis
LIKLHPDVHQQSKDVKDFAECGRYDQFIPAVLDTNEVLSVTDILITDFSGIYFDFLSGGRPIIFYVPDFDEFREYRGLYLTKEDLPGPITGKLSQVSNWILMINQRKAKYKDIYEKQRIKYVPHEDGKSGERIWNVILDGDRGKSRVIDGFITKKIKLLIYLGRVKINGINESLHSLLKGINYDKFDVSVIIKSSTEQNIMEQINDFTTKVRVLPRTGQYNATLDEMTNNSMVLEYGLDDPDIAEYYSESFYHKEYRRNFGDAKFDYIVNFTGYSAFYSILLLQAKEAKKYIWLHSDMMKDKDRTVNGEKINDKALNTVFSTYPYYDKLLSCSESVMKVNRDAIATEATYCKFMYCRNLVNFSRVFDGREQEERVTMDGKVYLMKEKTGEYPNHVMTANLTPLPDKNGINFVTMGRLSPEKNHINLIRAFARFNRENVSESRLYILGDGPLMGKMQNAQLTKTGHFT